MDFRSLLQTMYTINEGETKETTKGREHKGTYGTSHGKEDVRDQYGHKIGKVNKDAEGKKDAPKKGRGRPKKGADDSGEVKSYDTKSLGDVFGGGKKPSKDIGKKSVKHSLKDWIESVETNTLNEDGQYVTKPIPQQATQLQQVIGPDGRPALNQPIPTSAALRVASALSSSDGSQGMAEGEIDTSRMNKQHQDFYKKNPNMKRDDREVKHVGDRLASKVTPTNKPAQVTKKPITGFREERVEEGFPAYAKGNKKFGKYKKKEVDEGNDGNLANNAKPYDKVTRGDVIAGRLGKDEMGGKKKKVKESLSFNEMTGETTAEMQDMLAELQQDIDHFNTTGHCSDKLEAFLKIHGHAKKKITDEAANLDKVISTAGQTPPIVPSKKPENVPARTASPGFGSDWKPLSRDTTGSGMGSIKGGVWQSDLKGTVKAPSGDPEGVPESTKANGFLKSLSPFSMTESKNMKDIQLENWEKELNSLLKLNEGITVSSSTGQQGSPDSVSINATDADAQELLSIVRQAGLGVFGGDKPQSNYGAPMHDNPEGHGTEPEMSPTVVGDDSDMLALIKKMTGISIGGEESSMDDGHGSDYEDEEGDGGEEGSDDTALQPTDGEEGDEDQHSGEEGDEEVDEQYLSEPIVAKPDPNNPPPTTPSPPPATPGSGGEMEEGNAFGNEVRQKKSDNIPDSQQRITTGGQNLPVKEEDHAREEGEETCNECGSAMYEGHSCGEQVEEGYSNEAGHEELAQLKALLGMGNDMHRPKHSQATGNIQKVTMETKLMKQSSDLLIDFRKLSGIK